ncbi:MAG: fibronectin type III domain-containing protein, partial [Chloroflexi bacterium]|nr:fibronectin type III domain-containing protein [Chloroflexota bacterium]
KKNDVIFYTSLTPTDAALLADFAIYDSGAKISNVIFIGLTPGVPGGIADCSATAGNTEVSLTWAAPPNNRSPITEYEVQYGTVASGNFGTIFTDDAVPGASITGLTNGTAYQFRVVAKNTVGTGPVSNIVNATPLQPAVPSFTITSPDGGEDWQVGTGHNITWSSTGSPGSNVILEYSTDGGSSWNTVISSTLNDGSHSWTVPNAITMSAKVRVTSTSNSTYTDSSNSNFTISSVPSITVTSPDGGEDWQVGTSHDITWSSTFGNRNSVELEYSTDGGSTWNTVISNTPNDGTHSWTVPNTPATSVRVRVSSTLIRSSTDTSNSNFTISTPPSITVTSPNGGEDWQVGTGHNITWSSTGSPGSNVNLEYSTDGGSSWNTVISSTPNDGSHSWTVPNTLTTSARVRVMSTSNSSYTDTSNSDFTIFKEASFPFTEDFESGSLASHWITNSTAEGRIQVTTGNGPQQGSYHLTMDDSVIGSSYSLNELILIINLSGKSGVDLSFYHKELNDENNVMPSSFTGSNNSDGVAVSADGNTWYKIQGLTSTDSISSSYKQFTVDLDAAISSASISYNNSFRIKFQQYDNDPITSDGFAFDDISLSLTGQLSPTWTGTVGVTVDGNSITKNTATGWGNSGAASQESFTGDGGVGFVAAQVNKYLVGGLSSSNPDAGYTS